MITITISSGQPVSVNWVSGMNSQQALENAYPNINFGVNYYGSSLGYMVVMINNIYDAPNSHKYWEFFHNGSPSDKGIDSTILNDGDSISFENSTYNNIAHKGTLLEVKHHQAIQQ